MTLYRELSTSSITGMKETSCGVFCQHPECWRANLRRVKEAVRTRNGIKVSESGGDESYESVVEKNKDFEEGTLPTLKVIDILEDTTQRIGSAPNNNSLRPNGFHHRSSSLPSLSPAKSSQPQSPSGTPTFRVPRPSPVSPTAMTGYQKRMLWKKKTQPVQETDGQRCGNGHVSVVGVHEMYENDELLQDWKDVYITSAYLIWCQTNRRKRRKVKSTGSIASRKDPQKIAFRDVTEDMLPSAMEKVKPRCSEPRRSPTVGQPYSPSRLNTLKKFHIQHLNLAQFGLEELKDFPSSVLAGIIQHLKPKNFADHPDLPFGLEINPKQQSSDKLKEPGTKLLSVNQNRDSNTIEDVAAWRLERTLHEESSRVHLAIDINSHFTSPDEEDIGAEVEGEALGGASKDKVAKNQEPSLVKAVDESLMTRAGRVPLPLASVGVPSDHVTKSKLHHCTNSIPRNLDLRLTMEPVDLVPMTPSPSATPAESEGVTPGTRLCIASGPDSSMDAKLANERVSPIDARLNRYWPVRGHMTSALRYSPFPVRAPAPTPISPERWGRHSRTSHTQEHNKISSGDTKKHSRRWENLSSVYGQDETSAESTRTPRASPEGEAEVEPVFLTEEVPTRDPNLTPLSSRKDIEELPQDKMIINIIENADEEPRFIRSPSPGSKTHIPLDILAEFQGDLYGKKQMQIEGHKMSGNTVTQPQISMEHPGYIAPGWRPPRSRTPLQFQETPSRKAPRPLRQPPADSVPKSLSIQSLSTGVRKRPRSTPPRIMSPPDLPVQQVLSDSSLASTIRDDRGAVSMVARAPSPATDRGGSIPPPPSPEELQVLANGAATSRLDPVTEVEESSSVVSAGAAEESILAGEQAALANLSEVEEVDEDEKTQRQALESVERADAQVVATEEGAVTMKDCGSEAPVPLHHLSSVAVVDKHLQGLISEENLARTTKGKENRKEAERNKTGHEGNTKTNDQINGTANVTTEINSQDQQTKTEEVANGSVVENDSSSQQKNSVTEPEESHLLEAEEAELGDPSQPPGSPDIVYTPDFTQGIDLSLDLEAELRAAMEGLGDLDGGNEWTKEKQNSSDLEAW